jgi:hypothetical protein
MELFINEVSLMSRSLSELRKNEYRGAYKCVEQGDRLLFFGLSMV